MRLFLLIFTLLASPAIAMDQTPFLKIQSAQAAASVGAAKAGAGYLVIHNGTAEPETLLRVEGDFPRIELHTIVEVDGQAMMEHQEDGIEIPAGGMLTMAPGGFHVMFMGLSEPFVAGDTFDATLIFENGGAKPVTFTIVDRSELKQTDHDHNDGSH